MHQILLQRVKPSAIQGAWGRLGIETSPPSASLVEISDARFWNVFTAFVPENVFHVTDPPRESLVARGTTIATRWAFFVIDAREMSGAGLAIRYERIHSRATEDSKARTAEAVTYFEFAACDHEWVEVGVGGARRKTCSKCKRSFIPQSEPA